MDKSLTQETEEQIRVLCNEIAPAEGLSAELHKELCTHVEDKLLGYLSGEVELSEADALVLAREHFREREVVRGLLETVHHMEPRINILRRMLIPAIVFIGLLIPIELLIVMAYRYPQTTQIGEWAFLVSCTIVVFLFLGIQYRFLHKWKQCETRGRAPWYQRWSTGQIIALLTLTLVCMLLSKIALGVYAVSIPELLRGRSGFESSLYFMMTIKYSIVIGTVITWLMWLDKFQIKGWVFLNVVFATTVIHGLIGFCTHLFRLKPTGDPNILVHGIELVQFERFHLLLNSRVHLSMYYIMKDAFILATIIGLVYMFLSYYRNRRIVLSGLVVED